MLCADVCRNMNVVDAIMNSLGSFTNDLEQKIFQRTRELEEEQMKGEMLLYSMMPPSVMCHFT